MCLRALICSLATLLAAGCTTATTPIVSAPNAPAKAQPDAKQSLYWAFFGGLHQSNPQLQLATPPLSKATKPKDINGTSGNMLTNICCVRLYKNLIWVLTGPNGSGNANELLIFRTPLKTNATPLYYDILEDSDFAVHMQFDAQGNLWVSSLGHSRAASAVYEYSSDDFFQQGATINPALTLTVGLNGPQGLGFDKNGYLYVANGGENNIAVFAKPIQNQQPYYLDGIADPGGLAFDKRGNLFAASNDGSTGAVVEYSSTDLQSGNTPTVVDATGINSSPYGSDLQFDKSGNLYDGDCGNSPGIYTYALSSQTFSSTLQPSFYTNTAIGGFGCVWSVGL